MAVDLELIEKRREIFRSYFPEILRANEDYMVFIELLTWLMGNVYGEFSIFTDLIDIDEMPEQYLPFIAELLDMSKVIGKLTIEETRKILKHGVLIHQTKGSVANIHLLAKLMLGAVAVQVIPHYYNFIHFYPDPYKKVLFNYATYNTDDDNHGKFFSYEEQFAVLTDVILEIPIFDEDAGPNRAFEIYDRLRYLVECFKSPGVLFNWIFTGFISGQQIGGIEETFDQILFSGSEDETVQIVTSDDLVEIDVGVDTETGLLTLSEDSLETTYGLSDEETFDQLEENYETSIYNWTVYDKDVDILFNNPNFVFNVDTFMGYDKPWNPNDELLPWTSTYSEDVSVPTITNITEILDISDSFEDTILNVIKLDTDSFIYNDLDTDNLNNLLDDLVQIMSDIVYTDSIDSITSDILSSQNITNLDNENIPLISISEESLEINNQEDDIISDVIASEEVVYQSYFTYDQNVIETDPILFNSTGTYNSSATVYFQYNQNNIHELNDEYQSSEAIFNETETVENIQVYSDNININQTNLETIQNISESEISTYGLLEENPMTSIIDGDVEGLLSYYDIGGSLIQESRTIT